MEVVMFTDIAYNRPCCIAINVGKGAEEVKRDMSFGVCVSYVFEAVHNGSIIKLKVSDSRKEKIEELGCDEEGMLYLFFHAKGGVYRGDVDRIAYFRKIMRCDKLTAKEYLYKVAEYRVI